MTAQPRGRSAAGRRRGGERRVRARDPMSADIKRPMRCRGMGRRSPSPRGTTQPTRSRSTRSKALADGTRCAKHAGIGIAGPARRRTGSWSTTSTIGLQPDGRGRQRTRSSSPRPAEDLLGGAVRLLRAAADAGRSLEAERQPLRLRRHRREHGTVRPAAAHLPARHGAITTSFMQDGRIDPHHREA